MRKLVIKILVIFLPLTLFFVLLYLMPYFLPLDYSASSYLAADIDKQQLLENTPSPKIVFVGGSNLAFGLNSKKIEESLNRPVINMGLHASLGFGFMLNEIKPFVNQGDIIILVPEYVHFYDGYYRQGDGNIIAGLLYVNPRAGQYLPPAIKYRAVLENLSILARFRMGDLLDYLLKDPERIRTHHGETVYYRRAFNENGDLVNYSKQGPLQAAESTAASYPEKIDPKILDFLNDFTAFAAGKNARLFFSFPPLVENFYRVNKKQLSVLSQDLSENTKIEFLDSPLDCVFPDTLFLDSIHHLNKQGREIRTDKMIVGLKKAVAGRSNAALSGIKK